MYNITLTGLKSKIVIFLLLLMLYLSSCQWNSKIEKGVIIMKEDSILPNYSYKGYDVSPFYHPDFVMPFSIGEEYLVMYQKKKGGVTVLEEHQIVDTISRKEMRSEQGYITIPVFEDGSSHNSSLDYMLFFKGFKTFNKDFQKKKTTDEKSERLDKGSYDKIYHSWKEDGKKYCYTDKALKKKNINEISFSIGSKEQVLIHKLTIDTWMGAFFIKSAMDLDGDGINDLVIEAYHGSESIVYYFLFLSSEAEKGELLKHVATKAIVYKNRNSNSEDQADFY